MATSSAKHVRVVAGLGLALVLSGCPYESKEPIAPVESAVLDSGLTGPWRCLSDGAKDDDKTARITFTPFDEHQYVVNLEAPGEDLAACRAHAVKLRDVKFLSIQMLEGKPEAQWALLRYAFIDSDLLKLRFVADKLLMGKTPAEARALIEKNLEAPELYEPGYVCVRIPKK
jgi:hypothetical protein